MHTTIKQAIATIIFILIAYKLLILTIDYTYILIDNPTTALWISIILTLWLTAIFLFFLARILVHLRTPTNNQRQIIYTDRELETRDRSKLGDFETHQSTLKAKYAIRD